MPPFLYNLSHDTPPSHTSLQRLLTTHNTNSTPTTTTIRPNLLTVLLRPRLPPKPRARARKATRTMRLPYAPQTAPDSASQTDKDIYARISARRAPRPLIALDRALLHAPPVADGWNSFLGAIRSRTTLPAASIQELAICRVAVLNRAAYEWDAHSVLAMKDGGEGDGPVSEEGLKTVLDAEEWTGEGLGERLERLKEEVGGNTKGGLSWRQWVVLAYTDQMTREVQVDEAIWEAVRGEFGERQSVELTATVAAYNCVSRFLAALDVGEKNGAGMEVPKK
ncbi:hypothetical protein K461DRAFT_295983 [Myriangium duriaei CBS 260.36]|uniref:Carboxymuconolactone decarboxylase-like domain-containing protein n=1 Tax=Myriangium duriaei CBS 260.36 TaxID=1168546 RepID=A0A9P4IW51_9PEZI|nr:hypothetical protein K461DRAFT_295983 [Myriangium duriaei CBS 260.36]